MKRSTGLSGSPDPALTSSFSRIVYAVFVPSPSADRLRNRRHPLVRWSTPAESLESKPARPKPSSFPGLSSLIAASFSRVHSRGRPKPTSFRPRRFSRPRRLAPLPNFAGLFRPATTSRVRSSGVSPDKKPWGLVARRCPHVVHAGSLLPVARSRQSPTPAFRALLLLPVRRRSGGLDRALLAPLVSFASLGFSFRRLGATFVTPPTAAFHGPRRITSA